MFKKQHHRRSNWTTPRKANTTRSCSTKIDSVGSASTSGMADRNDDFFIPLTKFHDRRRVIIDRSIDRSSLSPRIGATSFTPSTCMGEPWVTMTIIVWPRVHAPRCVVVVEGGLVGDSSRFKAQGSLLYSPRQWLLGEVLSWVISGIFWFRIWEAWREISVGWIEISEWMEEEILRNPV